MATETEIKELAYNFWEQEGRPEGKSPEHYFRAREMLEEKEAAPAIELPPSPATAQMALPVKPSLRRLGRGNKVSKRIAR